MIKPQNEPPQVDKALHRYARQFYLENFRTHRFGATSSDYAAQAILSVAAGAYAAWQTYMRMQNKDSLGTLLAVVCVVILAWSTLHGIGRLVQLQIDASAFADEATLSVISQDEIERYFEEVYPWVFYQK